MMKSQSVLFGIFLSILVTACAVDRPADREALNENSEASETKIDENLKEAASDEDADLKDSDGLIYTQTHDGDCARDTTEEKCGDGDLSDEEIAAQNIREDVQEGTVPASKETTPVKASVVSQAVSAVGSFFTEFPFVPFQSVEQTAELQIPLRAPEKVPALTLTPTPLKAPATVVEVSENEHNFVELPLVPVAPAISAAVSATPSCSEDVLKNIQPEGATQLNIEEYVKFLSDHIPSGRLHLTQMTLKTEEISSVDDKRISSVVVQLDKAKNESGKTKTVCKDIQNGLIQVTQGVASQIDLTNKSYSETELVSGTFTKDSNELGVSHSPLVTVETIEPTRASLERFIGISNEERDQSFQVNYAMYKMADGKQIQIQSTITEPKADGQPTYQIRKSVLTYSLE